MLPAMPNRTINLHLVSDSTGETLHSIARATLVRFEETQVVNHRWSLIRSRLQLDRVLQGIAAEPGPVLFTLVDRSLRHVLEEGGAFGAGSGGGTAAGADRRQAA
jgi:[pyruvate, water dikinase]-phosphate phosphotransferase / [pyruvate, water dikinase] kinase